jgi:6-phosphogluconolactonase (cycloisomerase 2 family)
MIRLTLAALVAAVIVAVSVSVVLAQSPGTITQLSGDQGCISELGTDGGTGTCTVGRLIDEQNSFAMTPDGRFVYSSASGSQHGGSADVHGIAVFKRDIDTGVLTQLPGADGCVSNTGTDGRGGPCSQGIPLTSSSAKSVAVSPDGKHLYLAGEMGVLGYTINKDTGVLTQDAGCVTSAATAGCNTAVGVGDATHVYVSSDGKNVYVSGSTGLPSPVENDAVAVFSRDSSTGVLTQLPLPAGCVADSPDSDAAGCRKATALYEPLDIVESPDKAFVYAAVSEGIRRNKVPANKEFGAVSVFTRDPADGSLTQIDCNGENAAPPPNGTGCASNGFALDDASAIDISHDGKSLYVAAQGTNFPSNGPVSVFNRDTTTGKLTQVQCMSGDGSNGKGDPGVCDIVPSLGEPSDIAVSRDGGTVYVASSDESGPVIFSRDPATSKLTQLPGSDGCIRHDGVAPCAAGRATWGGNAVVVSAACDNVYFGGHNDGPDDDSSITSFSRTPNCAPTSTASAALPPCTTSGDRTLSVTDTAGWSGAKTVHYKLDGGAEQLATTSTGVTGSFTINVAEGKHAIEYWGEDEAHVVEKSHHTLEAVVDRTQPTITIVSDQKKATYAFGERASITIAAADENSGLASNPSSRFLVVPTNKQGKITVTRTATDACANAATASYTYTVAPPKAKSLRLGVTPRVVFAGERIRFDFRAYNPASAASAAGKGFASAQNPVKSATIRFAGHRLRTDSRGRAHITLALRRGRYKAQATRTGYRPATSSVRARKRPAVLVPQFTG